MLERILPADGTERVGDLFAGVLREMGKLQNFSVAVEGARVPLEFGTNTSCLIGQRVVVKYIPGKCKSYFRECTIVFRPFILPYQALY